MQSDNIPLAKELGHDLELLLPAKNLETAKAGILGGADALYLGFPEFNARGRADELSVRDIQGIIHWAHLHNVKVFLALNILIFESEFPRLFSLLNEFLQHPKLLPDALIVQDLGLASLLQKYAPNLRLHASTQTTTSNAHAITLLSHLGFKRFVLARENSLKDIESIVEDIPRDMELEVFIHGALCVSYSGQCFTSESIGGRSANRGECAQSCRFSYDLIVDGVKKNLIDQNYLLSPKDLLGETELPRLVELGVTSFKVEGRLKGEDYIFSTGKFYRPILHGVSNAQKEFHREHLYNSYSRGFFSGWLNGVNHQQLVDGTYSEHRGVYIGDFSSRRKDPKWGHVYKIQKSALAHWKSLKAGDGLLFFAGHLLKDITRDVKQSEWVEKGGRIFHVCGEYSKNGVTWVEVAFGKRESEGETFLPDNFLGAKVYVTNSPQLDRELQKTIHQEHLTKKVPIFLSAFNIPGKKLTIKAHLKNSRYAHYEVEVESESILIENQSHSHEFFLKEMGSLHGTPFDFHFEFSNPEFYFYLPPKEVKILRRSIVDQFLTMDHFLERGEFSSPFFLPTHRIHKLLTGKPRANILLREPSQVTAFLKFFEHSKHTHFRKYLGIVILDFDFGKDYEEDLKRLNEASFTVYLATNRILKPKEHHHLNHLCRLSPAGILVRNLGAFQYLKHTRAYAGKLVGDFSLNVSNSHTVRYLLGQNFDGLNLSYDCSQEELENLLITLNGEEWNAQPMTNFLEITVSHFMPSFHMEHCVFAQFLSKGSSYLDCGKPCEKYTVELKDQFGNFHKIKADSECRNTMYNFKAKDEFLNHLKTFHQLGANQFRFEALKENEYELHEKLRSLFLFFQEQF